MTGKFTKAIVRKYIGEDFDPADVDIRAKFGYLESITSTVVNFILFVVKLIAGLLIHSLALIADAFHTLSDIGTSIVIFMGFRISRKPPDPEHPFGHGRAEYISTLIVSLLIIVTGVEFIKEAVRRILSPEEINASPLLIAVVILTIIIKELLGRFSRDLGKLIDSDSLKADFWHHRTDALSSILVVIAILGNMLGVLVLDGVVALLVAGFLIWTGIAIARNAVDRLIGNPPTKEEVRKIRELAKSVEGVIDAHDISVYNYGAHNFIGLHVEVDQKESSARSHDIAEQVQKLLMDRLGSYSTVHVDPIVTDSVEIRKASEIILQELQEIECLEDFHDLRIVHTDEHYVILFDIVGKVECKRSEIGQAVARLKKKISAAFPGAEILIEQVPLHVYK